MGRVQGAKRRPRRSGRRGRFTTAARAVVLLAFVGGLVAPAAALAEIPRELTLTPQQVKPTEYATATGSGWNADAVEIWAMGDPDIQLAQADVVDGSFTTEPFSVEMLGPGVHSIYACAY